VFCGEAEGSGVLQDILSSFWQHFFLRYAEGESEKVPLVHTDLTDTRLDCVGRVLRFGLAVHVEGVPLHFFPPQMCLASIMAAVHSCRAVPQEMLLRSFFNVLGEANASCIRPLYENPKNGQPDDYEYANDILDDLFNMSCLVTKENICTKILEIAEVHLLQKAETPLKRMGVHTLSTEFPDLFGSVENLSKFAEQFYPSAQDVVAALDDGACDSEEKRKAVKNLRKFIRSLKRDEISQFLRFVTGSAMKPSRIQVAFSSEADRPITARTCSSLLNIPLGLTASQFGSTFREIISSEMYLTMTSNLPSARN
jgi:hypothetical protein